MIKSFLFLLYLWFVKNERFDVLSVHFVTEAWVARLFRFIFKVPFVFVLEGYTPLEGQAARKAQAAIAISQDLADRVWRFHGFRPTVIAIGIDEGQFNLSVDGSKDREKYLGDFEKLILTVGRVEPRKDYPTLVEAARIINSLSHRYRWLIVGEGIDQEKISYLIKDKGLGQTVLMLGAVSEDEKARLYRASDLLVLPTLYEGFGIVFVEAMACGLPVVSTLVGAVPEVVDGAGLLVEPKKPELLAKAVTEVLENKGLYKTLASKALLAAQRYNWDRLVVEYEKVYQKVIKYV